MEYGGIALFVWFQWLVPAELSVCLPDSCLVVPILVATQEIHHSTYIASHVVGHNGPGLHQAIKVLPLQKNLFSIWDILQK